MTEIQKELFLLKDEKYKDFHASLMPTADKNKIIGIRTPVLRKYAQELYKQKRWEEFINTLPHEYYEENNLHGILICKIKDFDRCINALDNFLPFIDNWASCDILSPKALRQNPVELLTKIRQWLNSDHAYTVRYGVKCLMDNFLGENFTDEVLQMVCSVTHDDYYVKMVQAWFFATALAKQYDSTLPCLTQKKLSPWVHNKTIQKAVESYRISNETKEELKKLKIKQYLPL